MKKLQYRIEYLVFRLFSVITLILPKNLFLRFAKGLGLFLYYSGVRKKVVQTNLEIAFGKERDQNVIRQIRKDTYINASMVTFEFLFMRHMKPEELSHFITLEGIEVLTDALKEGKGAIVAGNHFGNWELVTAAISQAGNPLHIFTGMQKNKLVDDAINGIRRRFGTCTISKAKSAAFEMMKALKNNNPLGMAGDLNVPHDNLFVDFFGKKAVVGQGLATFAIKRKAPLIFIWNVRYAPFKYVGYLKRLHYQLTGDTQNDLERLAQMISSELEDKIRCNPDQYFWFNRRWKTRPPDDPDPVY